MGTSAFDAAWDGKQPDALDHLWDAPPKHDFHAEFKSGALQQRMQGANARDMASAKEEDAAQPGYVERGLTHVLNAAQGIPGMEAVEAEAGRQGSTLTDHPMDYKTSLQTLRDRTGQIGGKASFAEKAMGGLATLPFLPASGAKAGAILGGADQLLSADSDRGALERVARGAGGAAIGGVVGKTAEMAGPYLRSLIAKSTPANLIARDAARSESAKAMYSASINANKGMPLPDQATAFLNHPDVKPIAKRLLSMDLGLQPDSPELFDAVYKALSDQQRGVEKGLGAVDPANLNMKQATLKHIGALKDKFMQATTQPGTRGTTPAAPPLPGYGEAVQDYARQSGDMKAVERGNDALTNAVSSGKVAGKNAVKKSREGLSQWAESAEPSQLQGASEGILGNVKASPKLTFGHVLGTPFMPKPSPELSAAPDLLRRVQDPTQAAHDLLVKLGLLTGNAAIQ